MLKQEVNNKKRSIIKNMENIVKPYLHGSFPSPKDDNSKQES